MMAGSLIPKGQSSNIVTTVSLPEVVNAPIKKAIRFGEVIFSLNDETLGTVNLVASKSVAKLNLGNMMAYVIERWFSLLR